MWQGFAALFVPSKILAAFSCRPAAPQRTKTFHITSHLSQSVQIKINHHKPNSKHASLSFAPSRLPFLLLKITWSLNTETREECTSQSLKRDRSIRRSRVSEIDFLIQVVAQDLTGGARPRRDFCDDLTTTLRNFGYSVFMRWN